MREPLQVVFVCTGNICRSPSAHAVLLTHLEAARARGEAWPDALAVESAGTSAFHVGELPTAPARAEGRRRGHTVTHRARQVGPEDFDPRGLVVAMAAEHRARLLRLAPPGYEPDRIVLFRTFDPDAAGDPDVADPYYGGPADYAEMFDVIERGMPALVARLRELAAARG